MLILHVTYTAKDGMANSFVDAISHSGVDKLIRAEEGNIRYDYFFAANNKNEVLLVEKWTDAEALAAHLQAKHMALLGDIKNQYIERTAVEKFTVQ